MLPIIPIMLAFLVSTPPAETPALLNPTAKWVVNYADTFCFVSRSYQFGDEAIDLGVRSVVWSDYSELLLVRRDRGGSGYGNGSLRFDASGDSVAETFTSNVNAASGRRVFRMHLGAGPTQRLKAASTVSIVTDGVPVTFSTPGIDKAFAALKACDDDLLRKWGVDPHEADHLSKVAAPVSPVKPVPYPEDARRFEIQGRAIVLFSVSDTGITSDCHIVMNSGLSSLDDATCATALNTRYVPAVNNQGNKTSSHMLLPIVWTLPG